MKHGPGSLESMLLEILRAWADDLAYQEWARRYSGQKHFYLLNFLW